MGEEMARIFDMARDADIQGVKHKLAIMHPARRHALNAELENSLLTRNTLVDPALGGRALEVVQTPYGPVQIWCTPWCPEDQVWVVDHAKALAYMQEMERRYLRSLVANKG